MKKNKQHNAIWLGSVMPNIVCIVDHSWKLSLVCFRLIMFPNWDEVPFVFSMKRPLAFLAVWCFLIPLRFFICNQRPTLKIVWQRKYHVSRKHPHKQMHTGIDTHDSTWTKRLSSTRTHTHRNLNGIYLCIPRRAISSLLKIHIYCFPSFKPFRHVCLCSVLNRYLPKGTATCFAGMYTQWNAYVYRKADTTIK